nr:hypothetical protein [uncultured Prevotella sp.]
MNQGCEGLMHFPEGTYVMDHKKPYWELVAGISNIFKVLSVQYVRRMNYNELPTAHKNGVRIKLMFRF